MQLPAGLDFFFVGNLPTGSDVRLGTTRLVAYSPDSGWQLAGDVDACAGYGFLNEIDTIAGLFLRNRSPFRDLKLYLPAVALRSRIETHVPSVCSIAGKSTHVRDEGIILLPMMLWASRRHSLLTDCFPYVPKNPHHAYPWHLYGMEYIIIQPGVNTMQELTRFPA